MRDEKEWSLEACVARGCLPTGEGLEAEFGQGWWTPEPEPDMCECQQCGEVIVLNDAYVYEDKPCCKRCLKKLGQENE